MRERPDAARLIVGPSANPPASIEPCCVIARPSPNESFAALCAGIRQRWPGVPLLSVFCKDWSGLEGAVACLNDGSDDFLCCPFGKVELAARLDRLLAYGIAGLRSRPQGRRSWQPETLVGQSPRFLQALDKLHKMATSGATVVLLGETGTGKEVFARTIHYLSARKGFPFIPVNCGSLPDNLIENELFGHLKGAYTDASTSATGLLRAAEGGTLFLDEIDSLSIEAQVKLLRFLQDREYRPLGSSTSLTANVRLVAATNANLRALVQARVFREDLFYRLNILTLRVPALRERLDDIPLLADYFLRRFRSPNHASAVQLSPAVIQKLVSHSWPGNIRELEGVIHRAVVLCSTPVVSACDIDFALDQNETDLPQSLLKDAKQTVVEQFERSYLITLLDTHGGNLTQAAREAGKERRSFQRLVKKYQINREQFRKLAP
jgi:DNA-binding NtrC family response regulator